MARCMFCNYEMEGRPERLERHVLLTCPKVTVEVRDRYRQEIEKYGKLTIEAEVRLSNTI